MIIVHLSPPFAKGVMILIDWSSNTTDGDKLVVQDKSFEHCIAFPFVIISIIDTSNNNMVGELPIPLPPKSNIPHFYCLDLDNYLVMTLPQPYDTPRVTTLLSNVIVRLCTFLFIFDCCLPITVILFQLQILLLIVLIFMLRLNNKLVYFMKILSWLLMRNIASNTVMVIFMFCHVFIWHDYSLRKRFWWKINYLTATTFE